MAKGPLAEYRQKRHPDRTTEPVPADDPSMGQANGPPTFVIQEHHASSMHWDFRLERDGVLVSWAVPKGLPPTPGENHLAIKVEDHPLEYGSFAGTIPTGEYGAGEVSIWDRGTYQCEKWTDKEVMVVLHGSRADGRYVLFPTRGTQWMIHRMDPAPPGFEALPRELRPMLAVPDSLPPDGEAGWAFEFKWDGIRVLVWVDGGRIRVVSRGGHDITHSFPELAPLGPALGSHQVVLDGELVVLTEDGRSSFSQLQHRIAATTATAVRRAAAAGSASLVLFDLLHLDGHSLLAEAYDHRRAALIDLGLGAPSWAVTPSFTEEAATDIFRSALELGMEGVVAKRRSGPYRPGHRSRDWIKVKHQRFQEVVIGGYTAGQGERRTDFGALLLGLPLEGRRGLAFVGKVGTGFTEASRRDLLAELRPLVRATSPFEGVLPSSMTRGTTWVSPKLVGEVRYSEWTQDGRLRHPVWRGRRPDKAVGEVVRER